MKRIDIVDSHTGGEPTRVILAGGPDLGTGPLPVRVDRFRTEHDRFRRAVLMEPRGSDVLVGAFLTEPSDSSCVAGVIFCNNVGYLGMCGHGMIGLIVTLAHVNRIQPGTHRIETPVGVITALLHPDRSVSIDNVPSYRAARAVAFHAAGLDPVQGDVAWGGNWFLLVDGHGQQLEQANVARLTDYTRRLREAVNAQGHPEIDHVELFGPPRSSHAHSRNFVLCPGLAYDRSPCGTGTSAKLACLAADGKLDESEPWVQESIVGSHFTARYRWLDRASGRILPTITGTAHVTGQGTLLMDEKDPFAWGLG